MAFEGIKLECLQIAKSYNVSPEQTLQIAHALFEFVSGTEAIAQEETVLEKALAKLKNRSKL